MILCLTLLTLQTPAARAAPVARVDWPVFLARHDLVWDRLPTRWGEKIVIRMLRRGRSLMTLAQLGFQPQIQDQLHGLIRRPQGMLLTVGPTGSGKTTTLYAANDGHLFMSSGG